MVNLRVVHRTVFDSTMVVSDTRANITNTSDPSVKIFTDRRTSQLVHTDRHRLSIITGELRSRIRLTIEAAFEGSELNRDVPNTIDGLIASLNIGLEPASVVRILRKHIQRRLVQEDTRHAADIRRKLVKVLMRYVDTTKEVGEVLKRLGIGLDRISTNSIPTSGTLNCLRSRSSHCLNPPSLRGLS